MNSTVGSPRSLAFATSILLLTALVGGCSAMPTAATATPSTAPSAAATAAPTPSSAATPTPTSTPTPIPTQTPFAIADNEEWIAYQWLHECTAEPCGDGVGVYLVRPDGNGVHLLLTARASNPDWSPDGSKLVVEAGPPETSEMWILDADGTNLRVVTCDGAPCGPIAMPAWSPDGGQLVFQRAIPRAHGEEYDRVAIEVIDLATGATRIVATPPVAVDEYVEYFGPRWSPDGTQIVFTLMSYPTPPTDENILGSAIAIVRSDGSEAQAPRVLSDPSLFYSYPDWSPDGERIVFNNYPIGSFQQTTKAQNLYTIRPDGTDLMAVTSFGENDTRASEPTWTSDGQRITFMHVTRNPREPWGDRRIALVDADGSNITLIPVPGAPGEFRFGTHPRMRPSS